jgi:hypothetical protein
VLKRVTNCGCVSLNGTLLTSKFAPSAAFAANNYNYLI